MKVISLIENTCTNRELKSEHGLSLYIEINDKKYLLDTGASGDFIKNAAKLNVDLMNIDAVIISHNHYDHIGGLEKLITLNPKVKIYIKAEAKNDYYKKILFFNLLIGNKDKLFDKYKENFVFINEKLELDGGVTLLSNKVQDKAFFCKDKSLCKSTDKGIVEDDFKHELFVLVNLNGKGVILSSCSHNGIVNIVATVKELYPHMNIKAIIGGFHMKGTLGMNSINCTEDYINQVIKNLKALEVEKIYTCHCTGMKAFKLMKNLLNEDIEYFKTGQELIIE
ncbi:7,8-dihydropterin-6-yl-methyl-4-(beta-D-ribofuranosyl)aminobenzene 5'-phosphate synthase [Clostridium cavendishii DSM 21758]|uniref:7,8-dihydropterin-6-yl-methyl-4-(Beta-D-ribofuranosyl)aminobenzene 5'-phosphate synthase n=1 Tax=Clostridium cavendishii DSM 21758 TaxID=1121302 RepID=A0A1M6V7C8_9CLOT|nr:MBL fold metallo-hydrolase [Clostridium cavendishii]SHK77295.1 7,8-dihydropterin-6-yl-methyl-4-(beta-D-ribofuranosyl)aminobenzene 5'-phosphate synthase [Clostridium cavendishii DSM 21758]